MSNVQSLERALTILNKLSEYPEGLKISQLTEHLDLSKSTIHRLLTTLSSMNYITKNPETSQYKLGMQILFLSRNILNNNEIINAAKPFIQKLSKSINETVHLCIEDRGEVIYIDKIESNQIIRMFSRIGSRGPMYCTAVGKVLLSGMETDLFEENIEKINFIPRTPNTITTAQALRDEITKVKNQKYALDNIENEEGIRCIAAPIYNFKGEIVASFSVSGPSNRITMEVINSTLITEMKKTSLEISRNLGYTES
ncbi:MULTISPECIES: IclR family transcriptional regulator [unclassified Exiguobacterium]|uniref:IclR family transcriptional regulator n=1 Tax=unclassified Exiguobacterium TaxID=2644629 RepID=UPI001BE8C5EA|nr:MULTISPECIES: IclR family transcriptional regulator [unclassified Exiguobacterium]